MKDVTATVPSRSVKNKSRLEKDDDKLMIRWNGAGVWSRREAIKRLVFGDRAKERSQEINEKGKV